MGMGGDRRHSGGFLLRIMPPPWQSVPALHDNDLPQAGRSTCRHDGAAGGTILLEDTMALQAELFYFAAKTAIGGTILLCCDDCCRRN